MKKNRIWKKFLVVLMAVFSLTLLSPEIVEQLGIVQDVQAAVKISSTKVTLIKGQKKTLKITGTGKNPSWTSNNKSVASVSSKGVITAKKKGTAVITAKVGSQKYTCKITVEDPKLSTTSMYLCIGDKYNLKLTGTKQKVTWSSDKKSIATVSNKGVVIAKKTGTAKITAKVGGKDYSCKIKVKKILSVSSDKITIKDEGTVYITYKAYGTVRYNISDTNIVTCMWGEFDGGVAPLYITGKKNGTAKIMISNTTNSEKVYITVVVSGKKSVVSNYKKLKNYINTYGYTNKYGDNFIKAVHKVPSTSETVNVAIIYDRSKNIFELLYYNDDNTTLVDVEITPSNSPIFNVHAEINLGGYQIYNLDAEYVSAQYYSKNNIYFDGTYNSQLITRKKAMDTARQYTDIAFSLSNLILLEKEVGMRWSDLGFVNLK